MVEDVKIKPMALLIDAREAAALAGIGVRTWHRLSSSGGNPAPVRIGGSVRWRKQELIDWIAAGCPSRERWTVRKGADFGR